MDLSNVKRFGATGNGSTDDSAAIKQAITYAENNGRYVIYIPTGTYIISETIEIPSYFEVFGDGPKSILKLSDSLGEDSLTPYTMDEVNGSAVNDFYCMVLSKQGSTTTDIHLHDFKVDGNSDAIQAANHLRSFAGVMFYDTNQFAAERLTVVDCNKDCDPSEDAYRNFCICASKAERGRIESCIAGDSGYESIGVRGSTEAIVVRDNVVEKDNSTKYGRHAMQFATPNGEQDTYPCRWHVAVGNRIHGVGGATTLIVHRGQYLTIRDNVSEPATNEGIQFSIKEASSDIVFTGNHLHAEDFASGGAIGLQISGDDTNYPTNLVVRDNVLRGVNYCIYMTEGEDIILEGNLCYSFKRAPIRLRDHSSNDVMSRVTIYGNTLIQGDSGYEATLRVENLKGGVIKDNHFVPNTDEDCVQLDGVSDVELGPNHYSPSGTGTNIEKLSSPTTNTDQMTSRIQVDCSGGGSGETAVIAMVPVGAIVHEIGYRVTENFDGDTTKTVEIGDGTDTDEYVAQDANPTAGNTKLMTVDGTADVSSPFVVTTETAITLTWSNTAGPTTGAVEGFVVYTPPY